MAMLVATGLAGPMPGWVAAGSPTLVAVVAGGLGSFLGAFLRVPTLWRERAQAGSKGDRLSLLMGHGHRRRRGDATEEDDQSPIRSQPAPC